MSKRLRNIRLGALVALVAACAVLVRATAYDVGGHHYTLSAIMAGLTASSGAPVSGAQTFTAAPVDPYQRLQSFCVELPDLVPELDAVTQRFHVLYSKSDWQWGALGRCSTPTSRHMVATQWYIHGLTGLKSTQVRQAAMSIVADRQAAAAAATNAQDRVNLICEAGFGIHLLGDSFAHSQLSNPDTLYKTGNGHWKDNHTPDDILSRDLIPEPTGTLHWGDWVAAAAAALQRPDNSAQLGLLIHPILTQPGQQGSDYGETKLRDALHASLPADWEPYKPALENWRQDSSVSGEINANVTCDGLLRQGRTGRGIDAVDGQVPNCDAVWSGYLEVAMKIFATVHADPVRDGGLGNCDATGDRIGNGAVGP